jgi:hemolysin activation/secretion protein
VEFFFLRPRDIATYVGSGALDVGITGRDLLLDSDTEALEIQPLGFGHSTFRFAGPAEITDLADLEGKRVATSYAGLVGDFLARAGVSAEIVLLDGAVEPYVNTLGSAAPFVKMTAGARTYIKIADDTTLALRGKWGSILGASSTDVPATERFYAGGSTSIRGFGYQEVGPQRGGDPIGGRSVVEASAEVRHKFTDKIGGVAFIDAGKVEDDIINTSLSDTAIGAGVGMRYYTDIGPLRFDVGVPVTDRRSSSAFQIYISIGQAF